MLQILPYVIIRSPVGHSTQIHVHWYSSKGMITKQLNVTIRDCLNKLRYTQTMRYYAVLKNQVVEEYIYS